MRMEPPASVATPVHLKCDMTLGDYQFKKGDVICNHLYGLHHNGSEWQRPYEFLPDRFDNSNELSLTPDGRKRNSGSFVPFNGGARICLGKTFADANMKIMQTYLTQNFNFEHVNQRIQQGQFPYSHFFQSDERPIMVKLTLNK